jgi:hypothetical protein
MVGFLCVSDVGLFSKIEAKGKRNAFYSLYGREKGAAALLGASAAVS